MCLDHLTGKEIWAKRLFSYTGADSNSEITGIFENSNQELTVFYSYLDADLKTYAVMHFETTNFEVLSHSYYENAYGSLYQMQY